MGSGMSIFDISGQAMAAQLVRLNATASNLANAGTVSNRADTAYRAIRPVFRTITDGDGRASVAVQNLMLSDQMPKARHAPGHPLADGQGRIYEAAVDTAGEMVEMLEASRQYQNNVAVMDTAKTLILDTLRMGAR